MSVGMSFKAMLRPAAGMLLLVAGCGGGSPTRVGDSGGETGGETGGDFHSLVVDPITPGRIYVGGHTSVARSDDGGHTWTAIAALDSADAMGWAIDAEAIWIAGHPGVLVSLDDGVTFEYRTNGLPDTDVHAFGGANGVVYAAGPGIGLAALKATETSWSLVTIEAGQAFFGRILVDPFDPNHLLAADVQVGATVSSDGGRTWTPLGSLPAAWVSSADLFTTIYASGGPTSERSRDGGATWEPLVVPAGATLVEVSATGILYTGVHDGRAVTVWISTDDGQTWTLA